MPLPDVSTDALRAAAQRFDAEFRSSPEFSDWEANLAHKYAIELDGRRYPVEKIVSLATGIPVNSFSGGPEANDYVVKRGFTVVELRPNAVHDCLEAILAGYPGARESRLFTSQSSIAATFDRCQKILATSLVVERFPSIVVRTSYTQSNLVSVPWIAFVDRTDSETTPIGVFPSILFRQDGSGAYVALVHGIPMEPRQNPDSTNRPEEYRFKTEQLRADPFVSRLGASDFRLDDAIDLRTGVDSDRSHEARVVAYKLYARGEVPPDARIFRDIDALLEIHQRYREKTPETNWSSAIHLLLKWRAERNHDTIQEHQRIAEAKGAVWWGKFGESGMSGDRLSQFRDQLSRGVPTKVFLSGGDSIWEAALRDITQDKGQIDTAKLPAYYDASSCKLFVLLSDFRRVTREWFTDHTVSDADPTQGSGERLLTSRANPGYLRLSSDPDVDPPDQPPDGPVFTIDELVKQTLLDRPLVEEILESLRNTQRQVVLAGPPGTGKTFIAQCIAGYVCQGTRDSCRVVQFHPSYSYESFVEGLRPVVQKGGGIDFERADGVVLELVREMAERGHIGASAPTHLILIDEMNRANLPRVFGELMYLFEYRDKPVRLQYSKDFSLPPNLAFLGTMNTADRSIRSIDSALRRRFEVFELRPSRVALERYFEQHPLNVPNLFAGFEALNFELETAIDRHHQIGQAFFMKPGLTSRQLRAIWDRKIFPLIEEYFFDQLDLARSFTLARFWPDTTE